MPVGPCWHFDWSVRACLSTLDSAWHHCAHQEHGFVCENLAYRQRVRFVSVRRRVADLSHSVFENQAVGRDLAWPEGDVGGWEDVRQSLSQTNRRFLVAGNQFHKPAAASAR